MDASTSRSQENIIRNRRKLAIKVKRIKDECIEAKLNEIRDDKLIKQKSNFIYSSAQLCQYSTSELVYSILGLLFLIKCSSKFLTKNFSTRCR